MGAPSALTIKTGVIKVDTDVALPGRWVDCDKIRFINGSPQPIGGNVRYHATPTPGVPRAILCWDATDGNRYIAVGTHRKLWVYTSQSATPLNITPARRTQTLALNPFQTFIGLPTVTVTDNSHGAANGDSVFFSGATATGGITIAGEYTISAAATNTYTITHSSNATSNSVGGGAAVVAVYEWSPGNIDAATTAAGTWGSGGWGTGAWGGTGSGASDVRIWSLDLFGSLLTASYNGGTLFQWTPDPASVLRAVACAGAPAAMRGHFVTESRFVMAYGTTDALTLQWPSQASLIDWTPTAVNTANSRRLQVGTRIVTGTPVQSLGNLIWTDAAVYLASYTGSQYVFDSQVSGRDCGLVGPKAYCVVNGVAYWMGANGFFRWLGYVEDTPRQEEIYSWFLTRVNTAQTTKVVCHYDPAWGEITWWYPSGSSSEPDAYVKVSLEDFAWSVGTMSRTASGQFKVGDARPILALYAGYLQLHEAGAMDNGAELTWYLQSSATEIENGHNWYDVRGFIPNFKDQAGNIIVTLVAYDRADNSNPPLETETETFGLLDDIVDFEVTGRAISVRVASGGLGSTASWGKPKLDLVPRGTRR